MADLQVCPDCVAGRHGVCPANTGGRCPCHDAGHGEPPAFLRRPTWWTGTPQPYRPVPHVEGNEYRRFTPINPNPSKRDLP